ncbi:MAG TPA: 6-phosphofructokinase, partial [Cyclobacteriaceae bacterium]|nr:6-phosphofructokinase [Cyclobacteriaceae bacterium]
MSKKLMILTGGGDCPGLNAVIRGIAKRARKEKDWEVYGCVEGFNGVFNEPNEIIRLTSRRTAGIHVKGGTILKTTNKANPIKFPVVQPDGTTKFIDRSDELVKKLKALKFDAV